MLADEGIIPVRFWLFVSDKVQQKEISRQIGGSDEPVEALRDRPFFDHAVGGLLVSICGFGGQ